MLLVATAVSPAVALAPGAGRPGDAGHIAVPEADLAHHGYVSMADGRVEVRLVPRNHGPSDVADATVRLRWSVPLADRQRLPVGCVRSQARSVVCRTGPLAADWVGEPIGLWVRLKGTPSEMTLVIDTVWSGRTVDRNRQNDRQRVLALDTGDLYAF